MLSKETRTLRSRSESPKSTSVMNNNDGANRESRDSSHGSSGTDTETRALLNKLECVENILEQSSGAIPKRKSSSTRVRRDSLEAGRHRREDGERVRTARRRPTLELEESFPMPATNTLYDDAAGPELFMELFWDQLRINY